MPRSAASPEANTGGMLESIEASPKATRSSVARRRAGSGDSPLDDARTTPGITKYAAVSVTKSAVAPAPRGNTKVRGGGGAKQPPPARDDHLRPVAPRPGERDQRRHDRDRDDRDRAGHPHAERRLVRNPVQPRHDFRGIELRAPRDDQREKREQDADVAARIVAGPDTSAADAQRSDHGVQQRDDAQARDGENERAILQRREPWQDAEVITDVVMQRRFGHAEPHRRAGEHGVTPPVAGAERQQDAQDDAEHDGGGEQRVLRHRFDDLEIAETAGHLHGADRAIDDQQIAGDPGDGDGRREGLQHAGEVACRDECRAARERLIPRPLGGLDCQPPTPNQSGDEERGADDVQPAPARSRGHAAAPTPCAVSQRSTSARYPSRACTLVASNRITSTGWVFEARSKPQPSGNVMRTPSSVETGYFFANAAAASSTTANFCSSGQSTRISGVANVFGRSASKRESGPPSRAT